MDDPSLLVVKLNKNMLQAGDDLFVFGDLVTPDLFCDSAKGFKRKRAYYMVYGSSRFCHQTGDRQGLFGIRYAMATHPLGTVAV